MICPRPVSTIRDLRRNILTVTGGRPRTNTNETEIETTRGRQRGNRSAARGRAVKSDPGCSGSHRPTRHRSTKGAEWMLVAVGMNPRRA